MTLLNCRMEANERVSFGFEELYAPRRRTRLLTPIVTYVVMISSCYNAISHDDLFFSGKVNSLQPGRQEKQKQELRLDLRSWILQKQAIYNWSSYLKFFYDKNKFNSNMIN
ncbi:unnamed protein product [Dovyalis caffra]|uniref:Uncharacterized protein n=1 Tax=Dovyalis caffra TaxID=77055 RepID=A0AAV1SLX2_9ROSI|nr:unnamed protein product [Dovyalis caffra]